MSEWTCKRGHPVTLRANGRYRCPTCDSKTFRDNERTRHPREVLLQVSNAPLRERFLELSAQKRTSASTIARAFGWTLPPTRSSRELGQVADRGDSSRVRKELGLMEVNDGGVRRTRQTISYERAVQYVHLLKMDPHEAGV